jgi:polysaccharide pyruvyl transferase
MRVLLSGYFSFDGNVSTAGDLLAGDVVAGWLERAGVPYDVARAAKYGGGVDWDRADPGDYSHVVWVCGPMTRGPRQTALRERFRDCRLVAVDVSLLDELAGWNPYDAVVERDSAAIARPDISFLARGEIPPVVGLCLIERQREYGDRGGHGAAAEALRRLIDSRPMAVVKIDTRIKPGRPGRRTPSEVEALLGRMDVVLTNRLHGLVLALKHAVPALAIDSVRGGAKLSRQAQALGWPAIIGIESLDDERLARAFEFCLTADARRAAVEARSRAVQAAAEVERDFLAALGLS